MIQLDIQIPESDKTIWLRLPVLLGIQLWLHPKTFDSLRLWLQLRNPGLQYDSWLNTNLRQQSH